MTVIIFFMTLSVFYTIVEELWPTLLCTVVLVTIPYPNLFIQHFKNYTADQSAVQQIYFLLLLMVLKHLIPYEPLNQLMRVKKPQIKLPLNIRIRKCCNFSDSSLFLRLYWDFSPTAVYRNYYNRVIVPQHRKQNIVDHFKSKISRLKSKLYFEKKNIQSSNHGSLLWNKNCNLYFFLQIQFWCFFIFLNIALIHSRRLLPQGSAKKHPEYG